MKFKSIIFISFVFLLFACEKQLEVQPTSNLSSNLFYKTAEDIDQAVIATYDALQDEGQYGFNFMMFMEIRSDNAFVESPTNADGAFGEFDLFSLSSANVKVKDTWNSCFKGIQRCNVVLNRIEGIEMDASQKNNRVGEAKFLRALTYFNMVRLWGDVPLVLEEIEDPFETFSIGRTNTNEVYAAIIADLQDAVSKLPQTTEAGRATKGAAQALLGKVYLTLNNWAEAESVLANVSGYSLQTNFEDNFGIANENGIESIFEVQFDEANGEGSPYPNQVAPVGSADELLNGIGSQRGENIPSDALYDSFEEGDKRRDASIGVLNNGTTKYAKKLIDIPVRDYESSLNFIVLRYADVVLMRAEALNEQAYSADGQAFTLLNQIRTRAGLPALDATDLPDQSSFRTAVLNERRHEFVSENSRWFDLVRTGKVLETMNASTPSVNVSEFQLVYPIPLSAIDAINNPTIFPQNPNY